MIADGHSTEARPRMAGERRRDHGFSNALETFHAACSMARGITQLPGCAYVMQRQNVAAD
jgi:hypothetical protein